MIKKAQFAAEIIYVNKIFKMKEQFKLIEGVFSAKDAKEVLLMLIEEKIKFHDLKSFSNEVKTGKKSEESLEKVEELRATKAKIISFVDGKDAELSNFTITSTIDIEQIEKPKAI